MALLHPAWLLLLTALMCLGSFAKSTASARLVIPMALISIIAVWILLGWLFGIYRVSRESSARRQIEHGRDRSWVFALPAVIPMTLPAQFLTLPPVLEGVSEMLEGIAALSFFGALWLAAAALVTAEGHPVRYPTNRAVGTFLLLIYWIVGAWFVRPRVFALLQEPEAHPQAVR
ncbi:MAG: hypothetical protein ACK4VY_02630 [Brevundimonas sp.]